MARPPRRGAARAVKSSAGLLELTTPVTTARPHRSGSYQPQIVPKRQLILTPQLEQKVLSLYSVGNSYADISQHLQEMYGYALSDSELTSITDKPGRPLGLCRGKIPRFGSLPSVNQNGVI